MISKQENSREVSLELLYNRKNATGDFSSKMESFSYEDVASGEADTICLTVNNQTGQWIDKFMPEDGDYVEAKIIIKNWNREGDNRSLSCGVFELDSFSAAGFPETANIGGITIPIKTNFNVTARNHTFSKTTTKTILSGICKNTNITLVYESDDYTVEEVEQSRQTDMDFAFSLCKDHGLSMKLYSNKMVVYDQTAYETKNAVYTVDKAEMQNYSYSLERSKLYDSVQIQYANPKSDKTLTYSYTMPGRVGKRTLYINEQAETYREAEVKAKAQLMENIRGANRISFKVKGDIRYIAARNINITGIGKAGGKYFIDRVTHSKNAKGVYICSIKAHLCVSDSAYSAAQQVEANGTTYKVVSGDCLWNLAKRFYGNGDKYNIIYNANKGIIKNPSLIYPGQVLKIPPR